MSDSICETGAGQCTPGRVLTPLERLDAAEKHLSDVAWRVDSAREAVDAARNLLKPPAVDELEVLRAKRRGLEICLVNAEIARIERERAEKAKFEELRKKYEAKPDLGLFYPFKVWTQYHVI